MSDLTENDESTQDLMPSTEVDSEQVAERVVEDGLEASPMPFADNSVVAGPAPTTTTEGTVEPQSDSSPASPSPGSSVADDPAGEIAVSSDEAGTAEQTGTNDAQDVSDEHPPPDDELAAALASLNVRLEESQRLMDRQVDLVDRLHAENQRLRVGELRSATLPLIRDLLRLHDDVGRLAQNDTGSGPEDMDVVQVSLRDALARNGVIASTIEAGTTFDPKLHSAAGVVPTENEAADRTIAEVVRVGFHWEDGQVVRAADVRVFKYRAPAEVPNPAPDGPETINGDS